MKRKEDVVVFLENENLKNRLSSTIEERNEYAGQCEVYKNENALYKKRNAALEAEIDKLSGKLALEIETSRGQLADLSLQITKIVENDRFFCQSILQDLEMLVSRGERYKSETEMLTAELKEKLTFLYHISPDA